MINIYVSGPITGHEETADAEFAKAEKLLQERFTDSHIVNPLKICKPGTEWHECMRICIKALCDCQAIYMLPGWQHSFGASIEFELASRLGITTWTMSECFTQHYQK